MAHPLIEALYIGLLASGPGHAVDVANLPVTSLPSCPYCVESGVRSPRVVYNWAAGTRSIYGRGGITVPDGSPMVGMTEWQVRRLAGRGDS
ncbi:MAG: hypothetical protein KDI88_00045 [Gammaproteobacteria bacterium]|nr:hypothetical protein [Gammaproteobacteria bacterium]